MIYAKRTGQVQPRENTWKPSLCPVYSSSRRQPATKILKYCHRRNMCLWTFFGQDFCQGPSCNSLCLGKTIVQISFLFHFSIHSPAFCLQLWKLLLWGHPDTSGMRIILSWCHIVYLSSRWKKNAEQATKGGQTHKKLISFKKRVELTFFILEKELLEAKAVWLHCEKWLMNDFSLFIKVQN